MDTINGMRTFIGVVEAGSLTAAGERLGMSVALVSKYVGQLEERLDVRLLHRTTRSLTLTEIGKVYYDRCQQVVDDFDELENAIKDKNAKPSGKLVIAAPISFGEMFLTRAISKFLELHPKISINLQLTDRFINLADEAVDVAIRIAELPDSNMIARHLAPARIVCCASSIYLEENGTPKTPVDLVKHECIIDNNFREPGVWPFLIEGKRKAIKVKGRFSVNSARASREMILENKGIAMIPAYAIGNDIKSGKVKVLFKAHEAFDIGIYAIYLHRRHLAAKTRAFVDFIANQFSDKAP